jgi:hypothetical protein
MTLLVPADGLGIRACPQSLGASESMGLSMDLPERQVAFATRFC